MRRARRGTPPRRRSRCEQDVLAKARVEQEGTLPHGDAARAPRLQGNVAERDAVDEDLALPAGKLAEQNPEQGRFAGSVGPVNHHERGARERGGEDPRSEDRERGARGGRGDERAREHRDEGNVPCGEAAIDELLGDEGRRDRHGGVCHEQGGGAGERRCARADGRCYEAQGPEVRPCHRLPPSCRKDALPPRRPRGSAGRRPRGRATRGT